MSEIFDDSTSGEAKSSLISRNITVMGRRTSVRLEPEMWNALKEIAKREKCTIHDICSLIHVRKGKHSSLTAAIRVFLMLYFRSAATEEGHIRAGHGRFESMIERARISHNGSMVGNSNNRHYFSNYTQKSEQRIGGDSSYG